MKNNQTHTPGPWHTMTKPDDSQGTVCSEDPETMGRTVAVTYDPKEAPLIAAAPELLSACRSLIHFLEAVPVAQINRLLVCGTMESLEKARAAIAKAENK